MSELKIYPDANPGSRRSYTDLASIQRELGAVGIRFERWAANQPLAPEAGQEEILAAYRESVDRLMREKGFQSADVIKMVPDHPQKVEMRNKFLSEHTHSEDEVRFFVEGKGLVQYPQGRQGVRGAVREGGPNRRPRWHAALVRHGAAAALHGNPSVHEQGGLGGTLHGR